MIKRAMSGCTLSRFCVLIFLGLAWYFITPVLHASPTANWSQVRRGMKAADVIQAVGEPLFKTGGKVYQTWIYDRAGEILFADGVVVAITRPKSEASLPLARNPMEGGAPSPP